jgi:hypothetical protein
MTRFFNSYGESPHLQAIEDSYLKYLQQQYAKESHLKAVKKFQIMHALKTIQRFWKKKYAEIKLACLIKIQKNCRHYLKSLKQRGLILNKIRIKLMMLKIKNKMLLFLKYKRMQRNKFRQNILSLVNPITARKLQGMIRSFIARKKSKFHGIL